MKALKFLLVLLVLVSCDNKEKSKSNLEIIDKTTIPEKQTLNGLWELQKVNDTIFDINQIYNFANKQPTIAFHIVDEHISGFSGCNGYGGKAKFTKTDIILFGSVTATQRRCGTNQWEMDYFNRLSDIREFKFDNGNLIIVGNDERTLEFKQKKNHPLEKNSWLHYKVNDTIFDMKKEYGNDPQPIITFNIDESTVGGWDGCNNFGLKIEKLNEESYKSGGLASNIRGCYKGWSEIFFGVLGDNKKFEIKDSLLILTNSKKETITFIKKIAE